MTAPTVAPGVTIRKDYGPVQVLDRTGLAAWQWEQAHDAGLIPGPDVKGGRWSEAAAAAVAGRRDEITAVTGGEAPIGAHRAADRLVARTGLAVHKADIETLSAAGLPVVGYYKEWPLYSPRDLDAVDEGELAAIVAERQAWTAASVYAGQAAASIGWGREEFRRAAAARGIRRGRFGRYAKADLQALAADEDAQADRLLMSSQAADHLEIRPSDFAWLTAADLAVPETHVHVDISRHRTAAVPLYRAGDLDELRSHPDIDWEAVRAVRAGQPSPLRELAARPSSRATVIRRWVAELSARHQAEVYCWWHPGAARWEIDFDRGGSLTVDAVRDAIDAHPYLSRHRDDIAVATEAGAAIRWARAMRQPGAAVILDTETTGLDGYVIEVAVIDAATGATLLDELVNPGCPIEPGARWVHGLSDADVASAPPLASVLPQLLDVTAGRVILAYNAAFDQDRLTGHCHRDGLDPAHLAQDRQWACLMGRRSAWQLRRRRLPLGGAHRARGDCVAAYHLLCAMTAPYGA